jgi:PAS domain S-box-containing protein
MQVIDPPETMDSSRILAVLNQLAEIFSQDLEPRELMSVSVREFLKLFDADRAWLLYPCDPETPECTVCYEAFKPEFPGITAQDGKLKVGPEAAEFFRTVLASREPVVLYPGTEISYDKAIAKKFKVKAMMSLALKMQNDRPWMLGLHLCEPGSVWTREQIDLFSYAGQRLREAYNSRSLLNTIKHDIAKRQQVEASLLRSEHRFRALFHHSSISLWLNDITRLKERFARLKARGIEDLAPYLERNPDELSRLMADITLLDVNEATLSVFEAESLEALNSDVTGFFLPENCHILTSLLNAVYNGARHVTVEVQLQTLKGNRIDTLLTADLLPEPESHLLLVSVMDITVQKNTERSFKESQAGYRMLMETANDAIFVTSVNDRRILMANKRAEELTGIALDELVGMDHAALYPDTDQENCLKFLCQKGENEPGKTFETRILNRDGTTIPVEVSSSRTVLDGREVVQSILHDISGRIKREEQQQLLATVVEQIVDSVIITDTDGAIEYVNPAFERISGYSKQEVLGENPRFLSSGKIKKDVYKVLWEDLSKGKVWHGVFHNLTKDGSVFEEEATITPVRDKSGAIKHYVSVKRDITRQSILKKQVQQAQKMQAIGTLAGGVAHDFNNILTAIMGFAELSQLQCRDNVLLQNNLKEIIRGADRAGKLISQILTFSRQTEKSVAALRMSIIIKEALKLLRASLPANIEIIQDIDDSLMVRVDPTQMHQVVMNLCTNAYQAIRGNRGWIKVGLKSVNVEGREGVEIGNLSPGRYTCLTIEDNGVGISSEYMLRIFEPYFTTREKNEGTGLGLSVVHGIVTDHGGAVSVTSTVGKGSCFSVYLPEICSDESVVIEHGQELASGQGRVMLVDDEEQIVEYERQVLERAGYTTSCFIDSEKALEALSAEPDDYDLLITDMAMPNMTGLQLFREIRRLRPDFPVLICTGYSEHVTAESSREMGINGYLAKPFTAKQFAVEVKRVLDERGKGTQEQH